MAGVARSGSELTGSATTDTAVGRARHRQASEVVTGPAHPEPWHEGQDLHACVLVVSLFALAPSDLTRGFSMTGLRTSEVSTQTRQSRNRRRHSRDCWRTTCARAALR